MIIPIDAQEQDSFDPELSQTFGEQEIPNGGTLSFNLFYKHPMPPVRLSEQLLLR